MNVFNQVDDAQSYRNDNKQNSFEMRRISQQQAVYASLAWMAPSKPSSRLTLYLRGYFYTLFVPGGSCPPHVYKLFGEVKLFAC